MQNEISLSEVAFKTVEVGDAVVSAIGIEGVIADKWRGNVSAYRQNTLLIKWDNGQFQYQAHKLLSKIKYLGKKVSVNVSQESVSLGSNYG